MHPAAAKAFAAMQHQAAKAGIKLAVTSGYRSFERQLAIWNAKATGKRPLLDAKGQPLDGSSLDADKLIDTILLWSALPGCSRHHWGTDLDVFDAARIEKDALKLEAWEYAKDGPCHALANWLIESGEAFGFFLPYQAGKSGVSPEPWHISFAPAAQFAINQFDTNLLRSVIAASDMALKDTVLLRLDTLVERYVRHFAAPSFTFDELDLRHE
ncbi:D-alanyl-D-alanine carboxypeptidase-related protein [Shewanella amazonensis SB2B]|uniref:D-alanyl-D-alanine carboxypeptidase-related protein n=2 Tax=Shewanella amazonensis TaxID=60478 RepID=A1S646_SHEAM|nr:D-alanyl-D-alanine carboxypeptidase-related protein [Shewanella amazonensis SB2B]